MSNPAVSPAIGMAERKLRALLDRKLILAGLSFPAWTTLVFLAPGPLSRAQLIQRQQQGQVVSGDAEAAETLDTLLATGLLHQTADAQLSLSSAGSQLFSTLSAQVKATVEKLFGDISPADLETTRRTLLHISEQADLLLAIDHG